jgi:dUTPase
MFKVLTEGCEPTRGSKYSACVDLYAAEDVTIGAGETKLVGLGVAIDPDFFVYEIASVSVDAGGMIVNNGDGQAVKDFMSSHYLQLMLRSSLGKKGLIIPNGVGVIDLDYKDELKVMIHAPIVDVQYDKYDDENSLYTNTSINTTGRGYYIKKGDKIAQITLLEHKGYLFGIDTEEERNGGFGSTGGSRSGR